jgi:CHAD domain-containing protein
MLVLAPPPSIMARNSKWIKADCGNEPVSDVARRVIRSRLRTVCRLLPLAATEGLRDAETVHQMRVATRRAIVAIDLFESLLPRRRSRWIRKRLKRIRRAAGPARDLDVMAKRLVTKEEQATDNVTVRKGLSELLEHVAELRFDAQSDIVRLRKKLKKANFSRRAKKLVGRMDWRSTERPEPRFHDTAVKQMRSVVSEFFAAAEADLNCTQALHNVRLVAKRLRYAMEVFVDALGQPVRDELYPLMEELQDKLGTVNDHATARERYVEWREHARDEPEQTALDQLIMQETAALQMAADEFRRWWTPERAADEKSRFLREISPSEARCA